jgi:hypothetical protein
MYDKGKGVKQNSFKASKIFTLVCNSGETSGCNSLGVMYRNGEGVKQNRRLALKYFGKACDMKDELGCQNYAKLNSKE